ncbi:hypothetical protein ACIQ7D_02675 [Streptomyces sp. NPDC096310]|uniref:hypothetical protein n=1 Tax=Streptomyces sp. NPDC096310 TaxID=3366082 RepID=UPI0038033F2F
MSVPCPDVGLMTVWDRWGSSRAPEDEPLLTGDALVHADPAATNFLIGDGRAWLIDCAWAARGPGWADAVLWGFRLLLDGRQTPEHSAGWAATVPAFARAPRNGVRVLAEAEARSWEDWPDAPAVMRKPCSASSAPSCSGVRRYQMSDAVNSLTGRPSWVVRYVMCQVTALSPAGSADA